MKWKREVGSVKKNNVTPEDALNQEIWWKSTEVQ